MKTTLAQRKAFTVIELLVVIAILAVVASLIFPVFSQVRRRSHTAVCSSNLKQLGNGIFLYSCDWDGGIPFAPDPLSKKDAGDLPISSDPLLYLDETIPYDVRELLKPYGCTGQVWKCPLDKILLRQPGDKPTFFEECGSSYWYDQTHALLGFRIGTYPSPATNVIMSDYDYFHISRSPDVNNYTKGTVNLLFADFHVKAHSWNDRTVFIDQVP